MPMLFDVVRELWNSGTSCVIPVRQVFKGFCCYRKPSAGGWEIRKSNFEERSGRKLKLLNAEGTELHAIAFR